jgi:outer membrane protein assembly factor BamE (lipoprotein component of BamABCDE complex)
LKKSILIILGLSFAVYLAGCATFETSTTGTMIENDKVDSIEPGITTRADILNVFGTPTETNSEGGVEKMLYTYNETKVPVYLARIKNKAGAQKTSTTLEIILKGDIVSSYKFSSSLNQ